MLGLRRSCPQAAVLWNRASFCHLHISTMYCFPKPLSLSFTQQGCSRVTECQRLSGTVFAVITKHHAKRRHAQKSWDGSVADSDALPAQWQRSYAPILKVRMSTKAGLVGWSSTWTKSLADTSVFFKEKLAWGAKHLLFFQGNIWPERQSFISFWFGGSVGPECSNTRGLA